MGLTSAPYTSQGGKHIVTMKQFAVVPCHLPLALGEADPQFYGKPLAVAVTPKCVTQYENQPTTQCTNEAQQQCATEIQTSSKTVTEQSCTTSEEKVCDTVTRQVSEQQCENVTERKCEQVQECTQEKQCKTENVCKNEIEKQCTSSQRCEQEQRCTTETNLVPETTYEDQCSDKVTKVCDHWHKLPLFPPVAIASYASAPTVSSVARSPLSLAP